MPDIPDDFWDAIDPKELEDLIVPIYAKHFTAEDLRAAIEFHESPAGNKILDKAQIVMEESMKAGEQWGRELSRRWEETHDMERA